MSIQSVTVRCDGHDCRETTDLLGNPSGWLIEPRPIGTHDIVMHFCPLHTVCRQLAVSLRPPLIVSDGPVPRVTTPTEVAS